MRYFYLLILLIVVGCQNESQPSNKNKDHQIVDDTIQDEKKEIQFIDLNSGLEKTNSFEIKQNESGEILLNFSNALGQESISFNAENLVAKISQITKNNPYHQNLSVYLSEKQIKKIELNDFNSSIGVEKYEVINPSQSKYWHLIGIKNDEQIVKIAFLVPEKIYGNIFQTVNNVGFKNFKNSLFLIPPSNKIEYNSLRKLGKFNEGLLGIFNQNDFPRNNSIVQNYMLNQNEIKNLEFYFNQDYVVPGYNEFGDLDTNLSLNQSLRELFYVKSFSYKSSYSLINPQDSALEIQIDFKTKEGQPTIRFVMGGVIQNKIPFLDSDDLYNGLYLPLGFKSYENTNTTIDSYVLMGNTSGQWVSNYNGLSFDGVILYFDKLNKTKIHIWLMACDGELPVAHYGTNLNLPR